MHLWRDVSGMTSFTLPQLQRVSDIYAGYLRVRPVRIVPMSLACRSGEGSNSVAHSHSETIHYRTYLRKFKANKWNRAMGLKPSPRSQVKKTFGERRRMCIQPIVLQSTRRDQIETLIHELIHFTRTCRHGKKFWEKISLWYKPSNTHMAREMAERAGIQYTSGHFETQWKRLL